MGVEAERGRVDQEIVGQPVHGDCRNHRDQKRALADCHRPEQLAQLEHDRSEAESEADPAANHEEVQVFIVRQFAGRDERRAHGRTPGY